MGGGLEKTFHSILLGGLTINELGTLVAVVMMKPEPINFVALERKISFKIESR